MLQWRSPGTYNGGYSRSGKPWYLSFRLTDEKMLCCGFCNYLGCFFLSLNATWLLGVMARLISTGTWTKKVFGRGNGPFRPLDWHLSCAPSTWVTFCSDLFLSFWLIGASATGTSRKQRERHLRVPAEAPLQHQPAQSALLRRVLPQVKVSPDHFQLARSKS